MNAATGVGHQLAAPTSPPRTSGLTTGQNYFVMDARAASNWEGRGTLLTAIPAFPGDPMSAPQGKTHLLGIPFKQGCGSPI